MVAGRGPVMRVCSSQLKVQCVLFLHTDMARVKLLVMHALMRPWLKRCRLVN